MNDTYCVLPWLHLATHPHGGTTLCCNALHRDGISRARRRTEHSNDDPNSVGGDIFLDLKNHSIEELMNSDVFKETRLEMLDGKKPFACMRCYNEEARGITSKRVKENKEYSDYDINYAMDNTLEDGSLKYIDLRFVELRLGNICNVKCRTCNPWSSSKWLKEYETLRESFTVLPIFDKEMNQFDWPEQQQFWDELFEYTANTKVFYINGGEPTLIKHHFAFLQRMVDAGRTDVKLWYNINMTIMTPEIIDIWKQFDNVEIGFSVDDLRSRNEYLRNPTKWEDVERTIDMLTDQGFGLSVTQTISWLNYYYLDEFYEWATEKDLHVHYNFVNDPDHYSPRVLPTELVSKINKRLEHTLPEDKMVQLRQFEEGCNEPLADALKYNSEVDKLRNEDVANTFSELMKEMEHYENNR